MALKTENTYGNVQEGRVQSPPHILPPPHVPRCSKNREEQEVKREGSERSPVTDSGIPYWAPPPASLSGATLLLNTHTRVVHLAPPGSSTVLTGRPRLPFSVSSSTRCPEQKTLSQHQSQVWVEGAFPLPRCCSRHTGQVQPRSVGHGSKCGSPYGDTVEAWGPFWSSSA